MKSYVKQILRTPVQTLFIILLVMIVTVMLTVGGNLWVISGRLSQAYGDDFITIGTITQKPDTMRESTKWDAEKEDYQIRRTSVYNRYAAVEDLAFPEVEYIEEPEKRVYWGSYTPEYVHAYDMMMSPVDDFVIVAEFSPVEDCIPNESVKIKITKILGDDKTLEGSVVWFCDHFNRYPEELKADKTYVAEVSMAPWTHGSRWEEGGDSNKTLEYRPNRVTPSLYTPEGKEIEDLLKMQDVYEVTGGFYETEAGERLLAISNVAAVYNDTQPVVGTNSTDLLLPFYEGSAWVCEGRYPTQEEYTMGSCVCLIPKDFADNNGLSVGDQVMTRLYYTCTADEVDENYIISEYGGSFAFSFLGGDGNLLSPFEEKTYTIVGLYDYMQTVTGIGREELIVPLNSVENKTENYVRFGAMTDENTSFQIENGTIADFLEASAKHGVDNLIYTFYDRGYSVLMEGIQNLINMSAALLVMGMIATVILTLQISHIYITKRKRRLSIERLLGMTGKQCRNISLAGILILLLLGTIPGVAVGMAVSEQVNIEDMGQEDFSRKYSNIGLTAKTEVDLSGQNQGNLAVSCMMGGLVLVFGIGISGVKVRNILKEEPLYLVDDGM